MSWHSLLIILNILDISKSNVLAKSSVIEIARFVVINCHSYHQHASEHAYLLHLSETGLSYVLYPLGERDDAHRDH